MKAVSVPVDLLGAHLEAYINLLPTISTLRLCNRHGKGDHAIITQLPMELVDAIEGCLVDGTREELHQTWSTLFKCWEHRCTPKDHYIQQQLVHAFQTGFYDESDADEYFGITGLSQKHLERLDSEL